MVLGITRMAGLIALATLTTAVSAYAQARRPYEELWAGPQGAIGTQDRYEEMNVGDTEFDEYGDGRGSYGVGNRYSEAPRGASDLDQDSKGGAYISEDEHDDFVSRAEAEATETALGGYYSGEDYDSSPMDYVYNRVYVPPPNYPRYSYYTPGWWGGRW